jgi:hypothetical protein
LGQMALYYFDTDNSMERLRDDTGTELADDQAARDEAMIAIAEMSKDWIPKDGPQKNITMWVRNSTGETILVLTLNFALLPVKP